jgi:hypothetical protein
VSWLSRQATSNNMPDSPRSAAIRDVTARVVPDVVALSATSRLFRWRAPIIHVL